MVVLYYKIVFNSSDSVGEVLSLTARSRPACWLAFHVTSNEFFSSNPPIYTQYKDISPLHQFQSLFSTTCCKRIQKSNFAFHSGKEWDECRKNRNKAMKIPWARDLLAFKFFLFISFPIFSLVSANELCCIFVRWKFRLIEIEKVLQFFLTGNTYPQSVY